MDDQRNTFPKEPAVLDPASSASANMTCILDS